jgi:hypothetical protein
VQASSTEYAGLFQEGIKLATEQVAQVSGAAMKAAA